MARRRWKRGTWMRLKDDGADMIRSLMKRKDVSFRQVGEDLGVSYSMLSQLVYGSRRTCSPDLASRYERYFDVPAGFLFMERVPNKPAQDAPPRRARKVAA